MTLTGASVSGGAQGVGGQGGGGRDGEGHGGGAHDGEGRVGGSAGIEDMDTTEAGKI